MEKRLWVIWIVVILSSVLVVQATNCNNYEFVFLTENLNCNGTDTNVLKLSLTNGGPGGATEMLALNIYKTAYTFTNYGAAQAKAVVFFFLVASITMVQVYVNKKKEVEM